MTRVARVLAVFAALVAAPSACSKFGETADTPDAGAPEAAATGEAGNGKVERRVYVFGGVTAVPGLVPITSSYSSTVAANGDLGPWTKLPALAESRFAAAWAQVGDVQLAAGGAFGMAGYSAESERGAFPIDPTATASVWKKAAPMVTGRSYAAAVTRGTSVYVSGGKNAAGVVGNIEQYDTVGDTWSAAGSLTIGVAGHAVILRNDLMYVVGGDRLGSAGLSAAVSKASFAGDGSLNAFVGAGDLKSPVAFHSVALVEPWLFVIGGATAMGAVGPVTRGTFADSGSVSWETIAPLPLPGGQAGLAEACTVVVDHTIYLIGGRDVATASSKGDVYVGRVDDHGVITWGTGPSLPEGRSALGCAVSPSSAP